MFVRWDVVVACLLLTFAGFVWFVVCDCGLTTWVLQLLFSLCFAFCCLFACIDCGGFAYLCNSLIGCLRLVGECLLFVVDLGGCLTLV